MSEQVFELRLPVEATAARADASGNPWKISGRLFKLAKEKLEALIEANWPDRATVLKEAANAFDLYVAPIDIPVVPNVLEPMVDAAMRDVFIDSIGKLYDAIEKRFMQAA